MQHASPGGRRFSVGSLQSALDADGTTATNSPTTSGRRFSWRSVASRALIGGSSNDAGGWNVDELPSNFFDLECDDASGNAAPLSKFYGDVCLVVNVASF